MMDLILVKIFATALALSEVMTQPQAVKTHFDAVADQDKVVQTLRAGCAHMRRAFDIESINVDELISTALNDQKAVGTGIKAFHGINFADLNVAYHRFCKNENVGDTVVDLRQVIEFFNDAAADLPDHARLKGRKLPSMTAILDGKGANFADVFEPSNRRIWVSLDDIPESVQKAFVAAEDRRFYQHHGVDERGIIRAFMGNLGESGRPQGGSTITQQVVKNLLVGEDVTYERKIREIIVASRVESTLTKAEILELYLNSAYLGRSSWGVEMAARSYFGKSAKALTLGEGAMLAGLLKGPNFFNPDRRPERAKERLAYVLGRMQEDGVISPEQRAEALAAPPKIVALDRQRRDTGFHFVDFSGREAKADGIESLTAQPYTVHSTITQQVVKNLLVGEDVTYERKIREIIVASRVESTLTKAEILELYLNSAYLGRSSWGVEMAARSYFGKSAKALTLGEGAMLAGLLKGPNFFNPDRRPERTKERLAYVLGRMQEDGVISPEQKAEALAALPKIVALDRQRRDTGFHFVDFLGREAKADGIVSLTAQP
ncbi:MAG TPA: transglycosylase domain-containing protein, partial [Bradyrhizobium sp.]